MNSISNRPQFVFVTDGRLLRPTLFAMYGLLRHLSGPGTVHFWGHNLGAADWAAVERVATVNASASLQCLALEASDLAGAKGPTSHISAATMGRLHIPAKLSGRVLYLDGDIQVVGDLAPLFTLDLQGQPIAAVRDFVVAKWFSRVPMSSRVAKRMDALRKVLRQDDVSNYFNAGVLLIDTDAVRSDPVLLSAFNDVARASAFPSGDQDYLNLLLHKRTHLLNPAYNSSWGRSDRQRAFAQILNGDAEETRAMKDTIVHFHGPRKPWMRSLSSLLSWRAPAILRYWRDLRQFRRSYHDLAP